MWFYIPAIVMFVLGAIGTVVGLGPLGPILIAGGLVLLVGHFVRQASAGRPSREPENVGGGHKATGHAHKGQEHMTPDTL